MTLFGTASQPGKSGFGSSSRGDDRGVSTEENAGPHASNIIRQGHLNRKAAHHGRHLSVGVSKDLAGSS